MGIYGQKLLRPSPILITQAHPWRRSEKAKNSLVKVDKSLNSQSLCSLLLAKL